MRLWSTLRTFFTTFVVWVASLVRSATPSPHDSQKLVSRYLIFRSQLQNDTNLRYIPNSGICETTRGVTQYSGYIDVDSDTSMWFWFFEARNSSNAAPFTLWLNGGPGCSSMTGLFQENGPCIVNEDGASTSLNKYSWNSVSNMLYIDQPVNTGFSYGINKVNNTATAASYIWKAFQILFESKLFSNYASREFIIATEDYGGRFGLSLVTYFNEQNTSISHGAIKGVPIVTSALMINNGWYDPLIENTAYYTFASDAPGYGPLQSPSVLKNISEALYGSNGCITRVKACYDAGESLQSDGTCSRADAYCGSYVFAPAVGSRDLDDLSQDSSASFPPEYYLDYLHLLEIMGRIGAETDFQACSSAAEEPFDIRGDSARTSLPQLSELADGGLKILIWAGELDIGYNWLGAYASVLAMNWYGNRTLHNTPLTNITLHDKSVAAVANVDNFTFAYASSIGTSTSTVTCWFNRRVFDAGREVAAYQPEAALEIFTQVVNKEPLHSV